MTQNEIVEMARQAGIEAESDTLCRFDGWVEPFVAFANLVAAKALAQTQEPVAWMDADGNVSDNNDHKCFPIPLYTAPPQRTWVDLTDEDIDNINYTSANMLAREVLAKFKEENT